MSGTSKEIRTRTVVKDIRVLDKAASGTAHMKDAFVRTKQAAEDNQDPYHRSGAEYATDRVSGGARNVADETAHRLKHPHKKAAENIGRAKEQFHKAAGQTPKARKDAAVKAKQGAEQAKKATDALSGKAQQAQKAAKTAQKSLQDAARPANNTSSEAAAGGTTLKFSTTVHSLPSTPTVCGLPPQAGRPYKRGKLSAMWAARATLAGTICILKCTLAVRE